METKHPEISQPFKQVILELHSNGKKKKYKQLQAVSTDLWIQYMELSVNFKALD